MDSDCEYDWLVPMYILYGIYSIGIPVIAGSSSISIPLVIVCSQAWAAFIHMEMHSNIYDLYDKYLPRNKDTSGLMKNMFITSTYTLCCSLFSVYAMSIYVDIPHTIPTFFVGLGVYVCMMAPSIVYHYVKLSPYLEMD